MFLRAGANVSTQRVIMPEKSPPMSVRESLTMCLSGRPLPVNECTLSGSSSTAANVLLQRSIRVMESPGIWYELKLRMNC